MTVDISAHYNTLCASVQSAANVGEYLLLALGLAAAQNQYGRVAAVNDLAETLAPNELGLDKISAQLCALPAGKAHILNRTGINALVLFKAVRQHLGAYRNVELFSLGAEVSKVLQGVLIVGRARITHAQHGIGAYAHRILGGVQQAKGIHRFAECRNSSVRTHYNTGIAEIILKGLNNTIGSQKSVSTTGHSLADNMSRILQIGRRHHCRVIHSQHEGLAVLFKEIIHSAFHNSFPFVLVFLKSFFNRPPRISCCMHTGCRQDKGG